MTPPPLDQTPSVAINKKVRDPMRPNRWGTVRELSDPDDKGERKAIVDWDGEQEKQRNAKCNVKNLEVVPALDSNYDLPTAQGQHVQMWNDI